MCHIPHMLFVLSLCSLSLGCGSARLPNQGNVKAPIEMNSYRITLSDERSWKDWEATVAAETDSLTLRRLKLWPFNTSEVHGTTTILVAKNAIAPAGWGLSEAEHADTIRALEEKTMREEGVQKGNYELLELTKGETTRNGKKLYRMTWTLSGQLKVPTHARRSAYVKGAMYLYFPEGYKDTHSFYRFLITDALYPPTFLKADPDQIYPIIDGFAVK